MVAAALMIGVIIGFAKYIAIFTGAGRDTNNALLLVVPVVFVVGIVGGLVLKARRPGVLELLAHDEQTVATEQEPAHVS